jgi:hypothetical protein
MRNGHKYEQQAQAHHQADREVQAKVFFRRKPAAEEVFQATHAL